MSSRTTFTGVILGATMLGGVACSDRVTDAAGNRIAPLALTATALEVGDTVSAAAIWAAVDSDSMAAARAYSWSSSDPSVVTVAPDGILIAKGPGTAEVSAVRGTTSSTSTISVSRYSYTSGMMMSVTIDSASLTSGETASAHAILRDSRGNIVTGKTIKWRSTDTLVARVGSRGSVTAKKTGAANIVASYRSVSGSAPIAVVTTVTAPAPVASVSVTLAALSLTVGQTTQAAATLLDSTGTPLSGRTIAWSSSNGMVASVSSTGLVTGLATGSANIIATSEAKSGMTQSVVSSTSATGNILGSVVLANGAVVGNGLVEMTSNGTLRRTIPVGTDGKFSVAGVAPGTYSLVLQPELHYSMAASEPSSRTVTVLGGKDSVVAFVVQPALYADDFQTYGTTSQIIGGCSTSPIPAGDFFAGTNRGMYGCANIAQISLDPLGGTAAGQRAMRYDWPSRLGQTGEYTVNVSPRTLNPPQTQNLYVRWTSKESANFANASDAATGASRSYKFLLIQLPDVVGGNPQFGVYLDDGPMSLQIDASDRSYGHSNDHSLQRYNLPAGWAGQYHTYVAEVIGMGTDNCTFSLWMDGRKIITAATIPFLPGQVVGGPGQYFAVQMGSNINSGPDRAQSRWWREFGIYTTRPSTRQMGQ